MSVEEEGHVDGGERKAGFRKFRDQLRGRLPIGTSQPRIVVVRGCSVQESSFTNAFCLRTLSGVERFAVYANRNYFEAFWI